MGAREDQRAALEELTERLRSLRVQRRLSMAALPGRAELGRTTVSKALNGAGVPSEATVVALASALGADPEPLLRLRSRALPLSAPVPDAEEPFDGWYRQYVERQYGQLSVIGLDLSRPERSCWPLDAAYLSLEFATLSFLGAPLGQGVLGQAGIGVETRVERAEQALEGQRRILVRGLAGSGKTTLLQWLAVATARRSLPPELAHLADCLPFVLPLRTLVRRGELPAPHEYLAAIGCPREGAQPPGWVDQALVDGRALLLVDGLDEVPQARRAQTRQWLRDLLAAYPQAAYLVTTRPSAVPEGWLADSDFTELTVRPMSGRDVAVFVTRWHGAAAAGTATVQERDDLAGLEEALKDTVRSQPDLARLTTTPLLCALVCALHRDRRGHLPHGRMELYEAALSMLMHRRDRERDIEAPEGIVLTEHQSIQLLQRLAYWLIRNGQTELDQETARAQIDDALPHMPHIARQADSEGVLAHLVARSGLLRMPTADTIDFVHRTFQDYLGAKAAIEARDIPLLVRNAHDDQWEDVLRMAVAHARPAERASLFRRLITRGDRTPKHCTRLYLLATACLEHATELDPDVREEVELRTAALLPPRGFEEAETLAAVGPVILNLLPGPEGLEDDEAEAVIQTAARIGGDAALTIMKRFRTSTSTVVKWALAESWDEFAVEDYAREVLTHISDLHYMRVRSVEQLAVLRSLPTPGQVTFVGDFTDRDIANSVTPVNIHTLFISNNSVLRNLEFIRSYPSLDHLNFLNCPQIVDVTAVADTAVTHLYLPEGERIPDGLHGLAKLQQLGLRMELPPKGLRELPVSADLRGLTLGGITCRGLGTLEGIERWENLTHLNLLGPLGDFSHLSSLPKLVSLFLQAEVGLSVLEEFPLIPQLRSLLLGNWEEGDDLSVVRRKFPFLTKLEISCWGKRKEVDVTPLRGMADLAIHITRAHEVHGTEHFPSGAITRRPRPRDVVAPKK